MRHLSRLPRCARAMLCGCGGGRSLGGSESLMLGARLPGLAANRGPRIGVISIATISPELNRSCLRPVKAEPCEQILSRNLRHMIARRRLGQYRERHRD